MIFTFVGLIEKRVKSGEVFDEKKKRQTKRFAEKFPSSWSISFPRLDILKLIYICPYSKPFCCRIISA